MAPPASAISDSIGGGRDARRSESQEFKPAAMGITTNKAGAARAVVVNDMDNRMSPYSMTNMAREIEEIQSTKVPMTKAELATATAGKVQEEEEDEEIPKAPKAYKIALLAWECLHTVAVGGVAPHVTELAAGLERRGHEVHVFARTGAGQKPFERIDGVYIHRIAFELCSDFVRECENMCNAMVHFLGETEAFMNQHFDIVHCHDWLAAQALLNVKNHLDRRCVFTVHSTEFGRCGNNVYGGQSARIRQIEQDAIARADRVIAVSGVLCDEVKGHYSFDWEKLRCVYNGINCIRYDGNLWDPAEVRGKHGVGPMDPMVLFVGRMATQKGPDLLVEAIPKVLAARKDAKFVMVGDGYMKDGLISRCHELGVINSVRFTGSMSGQDLVDLFKAADIVAIPSRNEPFGIVTLEAWAAHKPVVVTKSGGPREFVWHDNDGYLVDTSPTGLAWGITNCMMNFEHAKYMGARGRVKAAFQFSWDRIAEVTNNVYDELFGIFPPASTPTSTPEGTTPAPTDP
uniref:Glycosyltransferase subfamily 4-like N-terminal domain-containing protein n=1 Tax=Compsopogon caeruleus TaxID=31354 RepID=A0A7S1TI75_9RHOD|mmetsp:Transcript_7854/g.15816  ORF Transcript_7854/g.15816 Transcript_7854/m.15816 type:complete len:516 (+) Transcript_7854:90-1637(+)|eukprot:CAMPEP_0184684354 /NCGR_PEP_ID=MMETSP0312-20130426/15006_1 /TAXON_ID=31354 /ORGANISM="Compsopogon coeruleus, Strain SAG 36.94" /LENGTH=515 /DNA_ID=CAMNT_0027137473 /DNA_START=51 /DNA_END=1601 /DNA_ORIENTATION=+